MNDIERQNHLAGNSAREWIGLAAFALLLLIVIGVFGEMLP